MKREPVTIWLRKLNPRADKKWEFNHFESGHVKGARPVGTPVQNMLWDSSNWRPIHGFREPNGKLFDERNHPLDQYNSHLR